MKVDDPYEVTPIMLSRNQTNDVNGVLWAEQCRCRALESDDFATLKELISPDIVHVHARGNLDNFDSYFQYIQHRLKFIECKRGPISVRKMGAIALMTGPMHNRVHLRGEDQDIKTSAQVMQVWEWQGDRWLLLAFQATPVQEKG
jgi:hypothetical protein